MAEQGRQGFDGDNGDFGAEGQDMGPPADDFAQEPEMPEPAPAPVSASPEPSPIASRANELKEEVSAKMNSAASSLKNVFGKFDSKRAMSIALTTLAVLAVSAIVVVSLWYLMKKGAVKTTSHLLTESKMPLMGSEYKKLSGAEIPRAYNGKRMTISFWVYIHDVDRYKGIYRHLWHRGDKSVGGASPLVFLDKSSNRMHIRFEKHTGSTKDMSMAVPFDRTINTRILDRASGATSAANFEGTVDNLDHALELDLATHGITIDYVPIQRWVHVAIVVNEEINGGMMYAYLDGELVKQEVSGRKVSKETIVKGKYTSDAVGTNKAVLTTVTKIRQYQDLNLDKPGDVYTGGSTVEDVGPGFSGLVSNIFFANHDLNAADIYKIYEAGPVDNLAAKLGLPAYGVRSPVYRM